VGKPGRRCRGAAEGPRRRGAGEREEAGSSERRRVPGLSPGTPAGPPRGAATHLASNSSGVSGHFAAKWAVTALDADTVPAPSSDNHSAVEPSSSHTTFPASADAMAQAGQRDLATAARRCHASAGSTSGGGSASPLLRDGESAHACAAPAPSPEPPRPDTALAPRQRCRDEELRR
jgi:hypothetical protein